MSFDHSPPLIKPSLSGSLCLFLEARRESSCETSDLGSERSNKGLQAEDLRSQSIDLLGRR